MLYQTINDLYIEIQKEPNRLSVIIPKICPISIEYKDYENFCLLSFWEKPLASTQAGNAVLLDSIVDALCNIGLTRDEALEIEKTAFKKYFCLRLIDEEIICSLSAREMENYLDTTETLLQISDSKNMSLSVLYRRQDVEKQYALLHSLIIAMLEKYQVIAKDKEKEMEPSEKKQKIFVVHGRDTVVRNNVELFLHRLDLRPIILALEPSAGQTIIEKIENNSDVNFAIILYTGCDEGRLKGEGELKARARQNVVFEHGYFCAKLGRDHVVALHESGVEIPSDLLGVVYISLEDDWKTELKKELMTAGIKADWTKA